MYKVLVSDGEYLCMLKHFDVCRRIQVWDNEYWCVLNNMGAFWKILVFLENIGVCWSIIVF